MKTKKKKKNANSKKLASIKESNAIVDSAVSSSREVFADLDDEERAVALEILQELADDPEHGKQKLDFLWEMDYRKKPVDLLTYLRDPYYMGSMTEELFPVWWEELCLIYRPDSNVFEWLFGGAIGCLTGETRIPLLDGRTRTMKELSDEYGDYNSEFWVYSVDKEGNIVPGKASFARQTRVDARIMKVTLDNGTVIRGTPNHPFYLRDGRKVRLDELKAGDSLMPFYTEYEKVEKWDYSPPKYERVYNPATDEYIQTHRIMGHYAFGLPKKGGIGNNRVIHHKKGKLNNVPRELEVMDRYEHIARHREDNVTRWNDPAMRKKASDSQKKRVREGRHHNKKGMTQMPHLSEWSKSDKGKTQSRKNLTKIKNKASFETLSKANKDSWDSSETSRRADASTRLKDRNAEGLSAKGCRRRKEVEQIRRESELIEFLEVLSDSPNVSQASIKLGRCNTYGYKLLKLYGIPTKACDLKKQGYVREEVSLKVTNHKVVSVEEDGYEETYNLTVEDYANYAVADGCFVGNTGKSTCAMLAMSYEIYRMSCLRDPHKYYKLQKTSLITFGIYAITKTQADGVGYYKLKNFIDSSPYFQEEFPRYTHIESKIVFKNLPMQVIVGSREFHSLGMDIYAFACDEVNFFQTSKKMGTANEEDAGSEAQSIYTSARSRIKSRFLRPGGEVLGKIFMMSSSTTTESFMNRHIKEHALEVGKGIIHISHFSQWEAKPSELFTMPKFLVELGDKINPPRILDDVGSARKGSQIMSVPGEYEDEFKLNIDKALRDLAGISTHGIAPYIRDKTLIHDCINTKRIHPFTREEFPITMDSPTMIDDYFNPLAIFRVVDSRYVPINNPSAPRMIHIDLAFVGDSCGIACSHISGYKEVRRVRHDGTYYTDSAPQIYVDFVMRIMPKTNTEIDVAKVRAFLFSLRDLGLPIGLITLDGYQSTDFKQLMQKNDFDCEIQSVEATSVPYDMLRMSIVERRIDYYFHPTLMKELEYLEQDPETGKVDHPNKFLDGSRGSNDVADGLAGSVYACLTDARAYNMYEKTIIVPDKSPTNASTEIVVGGAGVITIDDVLKGIQ